MNSVDCAKSLKLAGEPLRDRAIVDIILVNDAAALVSSAGFAMAIDSECQVIWVSGHLDLASLLDTLGHGESIDRRRAGCV